MATPLGADALVNAFRAEGVRVVTVGSWRTHNRNHKGAWGPINGVMLHHTAGGSSGAVQYCYDGSAELPGPLCTGVITKDGTVHVISTGRSNHAGGGDPNVLAAVRDERYGDYPPATHQHQGTSGAVDGNAHFYGFECVNLGNGKDPWPAEQVESMVRASAAICRAYGWTAKSVIAHKEWSDYKPDPSGPGMPSMAQFRARVAERLAHPASWSPGTPTTPTPEPTTPTPIPGTDMTAPFRTFLSRATSTPMTLTGAGGSEAVYWSDEHADTGNEHGAGGKTVLTTGQYSAVAYLQISGLPVGGWIKVYAAEENASGVVTGEGPKMRYFGDGADLELAVPIMGYVYDRLTIRVQSSDPAYVVKAELAVQHWGN